MEDFKRENFERDHPGKRLSVHPAGARAVARLRAMLLERLELPGETDGLTLARAISSRAQPLQGLDASSEGFDLGRVLTERLGVSTRDELFLHWRGFEELDRVLAGELVEFFMDIWYPAADDLDLIGARGDWVLSIAHHGGVGLLTFRDQGAQGAGLPAAPPSAPR
jgi:hypothetical protein